VKRNEVRRKNKKEWFEKYKEWKKIVPLPIKYEQIYR